MEKIKILIAENDEDEQFFMKDGFDKTGYFEVVSFAGSGDELLDQLRSSQSLPDIILSDLNMPGKNGFEILKELKSDSKYSAIPIVMTSTTAQSTAIDMCMRLGATKFMQKPETFVEYEAYAKELVLILNKNG